MKINRTKIVCTIGNYPEMRKTIADFILAGMDVARINFSHTSPELALPFVTTLKELRKELNTPLAIMLDTKGPESRLYGISGTHEIKNGDRLIVKSAPQGSNPDAITPADGMYYSNLPDIGTLAKKGARVLLADGQIECKVTESSDDSITIEAESDGEIRNKAHLSIPGIKYPLPFLSQKDMVDISFAVRENLEYIALSFVSSAHDILAIKSFIRDIDANSRIKLISKIENKSAVENIDEIIRHSDGIMVARGDMGVEVDLTLVPVLQKKIVALCREAGKPVIVATQMLESMMERRLPTRAEVSDVANACYDLTSAVMLSGETAVGKFPLLTVETMQNILDQVESSLPYENYLSLSNITQESPDLTDVVTFDAVSCAYKCSAKALVVFSKSGYSVRMVSRLRPRLPIHAILLDDSLFNQLALEWGVTPHIIGDDTDFEVLLKRAFNLLKSQNFLESGDTVVVVAGVPLGLHGRTNMIRVETIW